MASLRLGDGTRETSNADTWTGRYPSAIPTRSGDSSWDAHTLKNSDEQSLICKGLDILEEIVYIPVNPRICYSLPLFLVNDECNCRVPYFVLH